MTEKSEPVDVEALAEAVQSGDRIALARAITLVESAKADHSASSQALLRALLPASGGAIRLGITGAPGVGKSTLIDQLGINLVEAGHRVAVLAVDPTSARTGGSILGDKTRMARLAASEHAFIRPSPSAGSLGGVARRTREAILVCEAAGFDVVIVETVGIGQSEQAVADMVDFFLVLAQPGAGDELQGLKKGVLEAADMVAVTKADGALADAARSTAADYRAAFHILAHPSPHWRPSVMLVSGLANQGLDALWSEVERHRAVMVAAGEFDTRRQDQDVRWMHRLIEERVLGRFLDDSRTARRIAALEAKVRSGAITAAQAASQALGE